MIVLDNIIFDLQPYGGISTIWESLVLQAKKYDDLRFTFLQSASAAQRLANLGANNVNMLEEKGHALIRRWRRPRLPRDAVVFHSSYFRISKSKTVRNVVTVHDCVSERFDPWIRRALHVMKKVEALRRAAVIIAVSENTKNDLLRYYPWVEPEKIIIIHNGIDLRFFSSEHSNRVATCAGPYVLYVGRRNRHKNFELALKLIGTSTARELGLRLCVVGLTGGTKRELQIAESLGIARSVEFRTGVDKEELRSLYHAAFALFYPSYYEGFGIPPVEAMACGCPVITSKRSSIPEVVGDAGLLISPDDVREAEWALGQVSDSERRGGIVARGYARVKSFSDVKMAEATFGVYRALVD